MSKFGVACARTEKESDKCVGRFDAVWFGAVRCGTTVAMVMPVKRNEVDQRVRERTRQWCTMHFVWKRRIRSSWQSARKKRQERRKEPKVTDNVRSSGRERKSKMAEEARASEERTTSVVRIESRQKVASRWKANWESGRRRRRRISRKMELNGQGRGKKKREQLALCAVRTTKRLVDTKRLVHGEKRLEQSTGSDGLNLSRNTGRPAKKKKKKMVKVNGRTKVSEVKWVDKFFFFFVDIGVRSDVKRRRCKWCRSKRRSPQVKEWEGPERRRCT